MADYIELQAVKTSGGKTWHVKWDRASNDVYVFQPGMFGDTAHKIGKASDAREAMAKADAWAYSQK
jgi:hypothetical protein